MEPPVYLPSSFLIVALRVCYIVVKDLFFVVLCSFGSLRVSWWPGWTVHEDACWTRSGTCWPPANGVILCFTSDLNQTHFHIVNGSQQRNEGPHSPLFSEWRQKDGLTNGSLYVKPVRLHSSALTLSEKRVVSFFSEWYNMQSVCLNALIPKQVQTTTTPGSWTQVLVNSCFVSFTHDGQS